MKAFLLSVALTATSLSAIAEPLVVPKEALTPIPDLAQKCDPHCLVLDKADFEALRAQVQSLVNQAYEAGKKAGIEKERSTI